MLNLDLVSLAILIVNGLSAGVIGFLLFIMILDRHTIKECATYSPWHQSAETSSEGCIKFFISLIVAVNIAFWVVRFWR